MSASTTLAREMAWLMAWGVELAAADASCIDERVMACEAQGIPERMRDIQGVGALVENKDVEAFNELCPFRCSYRSGRRMMLGLDGASRFDSDAWRKSCGETFQRWPESVITVTVFRLCRVTTPAWSGWPVG
jgi:hypothetical protein